MNGPMAVYLRAPSRCQPARPANWLPRNVCEGRSFYQEITAFEEAVERIKSAYLERIGRLECQHYLKTGRCKFGSACKFYHPEYSAGITGRYQFNAFGYPLRPNVKDCSYYLRTGQCKFSGICIFNHPEPSNLMLMTTPGQQLYPEGLTYYIANSHWQDPSIYGQLIITQGLVQFPCWNPFSGEPQCLLYSRYGLCKFGPNCKFDHPIATLKSFITDSFSTSTSSNAPPIQQY